jgi:hypothetical protein
MLNMFKLEYHGHEILWADLHSSTRSSSLLSTSSTDGQLHPASQGDSIEPDNIPTISHRSRVNPAINMLITEKNHPKARKPGIKHPASVDLNANSPMMYYSLTTTWLAGTIPYGWGKITIYTCFCFSMGMLHCQVKFPVSSVISRWHHLWAKYGTPGPKTGPRYQSPWVHLVGDKMPPDHPDPLFLHCSVVSIPAFHVQKAQAAALAPHPTAAVP